MRHLRRIFALTVLFTLCLTGACAADYAVTGLFSLSYDESVFTLDNLSYQNQSTDTYRWLFMLYNDDCLVDVSAERVAGYEELSLLTASEEERQAYLTDVMSSFSQDSVTFLEVVSAGPEAIPFYMFQMEDPEGPYLMGETVVGGWAIDFFAYYEDPALSADEALMSMLTGLLSTFTPAS